MLSEYGIVLLFVVFGLAFVVINIWLSRLITWFFNIKQRDPRKHTSYECGEQPIGDSRIRFNSRFYLVALVFLIFDVETIFLIPIAVVFGEHMLIAAIGASIFVGMLILGLVYDWAKGDLDWVKPKPRFSAKEESI